MRKIFCLFAAMACIANVNAQSVGIGTTVPNTNAVLDIFSNNKGFLLPRIVDTSTVANPLEGMVIYNKNIKAPFYHDGTRWLSLGGRQPSSTTTNTDRITYTITGAGFTATEFPCLAASQGESWSGNVATPGGASSATDYSFTKEQDINSNNINTHVFQGTHLASIEFKYYATGASIPYASTRLQNILFSSFSFGVSAGGGAITESISINFDNYGYKDWVNNLSFGYSTVSHSITAY